MGCFVTSVPPSNGPVSELFAEVGDDLDAEVVVDVVLAGLDCPEVALVPEVCGRSEDEPAPGPDCRRSAPRQVTFCIPCDAVVDAIGDAVVLLLGVSVATSSDGTPMAPVTPVGVADEVGVVGDEDVHGVEGLEDVEVGALLLSRSASSSKRFCEMKLFRVVVCGTGLAAFFLSTRVKPSWTIKHAPRRPSSMALMPPAVPGFLSGHWAALWPLRLHCQHSRWLFSTSGLVQRPSCSRLQLAQRRFLLGASRAAGVRARGAGCRLSPLRRGGKRPRAARSLSAAM